MITIQKYIEHLLFHVQLVKDPVITLKLRAEIEELRKMKTEGLTEIMLKIKKMEVKN